MTRILVTGMSGAGKSSVLEELSWRGHRTLDTDYDGWILANGNWDKNRMNQLLTQHRDIIVCGTVENQDRFYDGFERVVLLSAPLPVLLERVLNRRNNPYGTSEAQEQEVATYVESVEPLLRRGASLELDGQRPIAILADVIEGLLPDFA